MSGVLDDISERTNLFQMCYCALINVQSLVPNIISELLNMFPNNVRIMVNIESRIENIVLHSYKTIQYIFLFIVNGQN